MVVVFLRVILQIYNYVFHLEAYYAREGGEAEISGGLDVDGLEGCVHRRFLGLVVYNVLFPRLLVTAQLLRVFRINDRFDSYWRWCNGAMTHLFYYNSQSKVYISIPRHLCHTISHSFYAANTWIEPEMHFKHY